MITLPDLPDVERFFAVSLDLWCIGDIDGRLLKLNPQWETTLGYTLDELLGKSFSDFVHPDDLQSSLEALELLKNQQPILNFTNRYRCKDGSYRYIEWRLQPYGKLVYASARDITERKQLELYQSQLIAIIESSREAIISRNLDGVITSWNHGAELTYGYTSEEAIGQKLLPIIPADYVPLVWNNLARIKKGEHIDYFESPFVHKDGSLHLILMSISPIFDIDGSVIGGAAIGKDVTKLRQLETYRAHLSAIVESSGDAIIGRTLEGIINSWNPSAEAIYGYTAEEMIGRSMEVLTPPERLDEFYTNLEKVRRGEYIERYETVRLHKDGRRIDVASTISPIKDKAGHVIGVSTISQNISELKQVQDALRESEARYRAIVTTMTEGVVLQTRDGTIQASNAAAERILGLSAEQMEGRTSVDPGWIAVHEDMSSFPGATHPAMRALQSGETIRDVVMGVYKPDDSLVWILINSHPLFRFGEEPPYAVLTSFTDITKLHEIELALSHHAARMQSILETIKDAIWSVSIPDFQVTYINPSGARLFGYPVSAFYEQADLVENLVPSNWRANILEQGEGDLEYAITSANGDAHHVHNRAWLIRDAQGQAVRIEGILSDVTEQKILQEQAIQLEIHRERIQLLSDFITNASHELLTPLTILSTGIYLMAKMDQASQRQAKRTQLDQQVQYLNTMIKQMLEMVKLDRLDQIDLIPIELEALVKGFIGSYVSSKPNVKIMMDADTSLKGAIGDADYIGLALKQLLDNAVRFSSAHNEVLVHIKRKSQSIILSVEDKGIGIAPENLERIFEHFYKVGIARTRADNGAGIGLAMVKRIMELHHGSVTVESVLGQGSIFSLSFPIIVDT